MKTKKVPVILQMDSVECGAACLAMILCRFGRKTRLEECRAKCDPGRNGVTAQTIVSAAREFGLLTKAYSLRVQELQALDLPCIIHWNYNHFVVFERISASSAQIVDPGHGRLTVPLAEFQASFTGIAIAFERGPEFQTRTERRPNQMLGYLRQILVVPGTKSVMSRILVASLILQAFGFALPLLTKELVDRVVPMHKVGELNLLLMAAMVVAITHAGVGYLRSVLLVRLESCLDSHLMISLFRHLLSLPYRFFQQRSSGDLAMRLGSNTLICEALTGYTTTAILDGPLVLVFLVTLLRMAPLFGIAALTIGLLELAFLLATSGRVHILADSALARQSESQSCLVETLMGISTLKSAGAEEATLERWKKLLTKQIETSEQRGRYMAGVDAVVILLRTFSPLFLLWLGGTLVLKGSMTLGTMFALNALAASFLQPLGAVVMSAQRVQLAGAYLERIADVMHAKPEQDPEAVVAAPKLSGRVELSNVSFRYDSHSPNVLENISLSIRPGQKVALVGRTGSGKSTLARLLLGLYMPTAGEVLYDGIPLETMNLRTVRAQWGAALQDSFVFASSLKDNIAFHNRQMHVEDLTRAANIAAIHEDIMQMPMGYETRIDEGGGSLSGGQRQRISLARAVAHRPSLLLLDEATSHLDVITEKIVDSNLDDLSCARVVIAHRLSTIRNADLIVVMDHGSIVEQGTHDELLARDGHYAALVDSQLESESRQLAAAR
jgi:ABC-type bacteriocin/lantibiotic exporter with double-glycine peptidase domain